VTSNAIVVDEPLALSNTTHDAEVEETATPTGNSADRVNTTETTVAEGPETITPIDNLTPAEISPADEALEDTDTAPLDKPITEAAGGDVDASQVPSEVIDQ
jgi:hypothetical protein